MKIMVLNGPNLNLQGIREPEKYGNGNFDDLMAEWKATFPEVTFTYFQSNIEGEIIDCLHAAGFSYDGIVFNPGAYTHTSIAIGDAVAAIQTPVIEVHISNIAARESFRHVSYVSAHAKGVIFGFGLKGYAMAIRALL